MSNSCKTADDVRALYLSVDGFNSQQTTKFYNSWAQTYEQDSEKIHFRAPHMVVDFLSANFYGVRKEVQVLDVACGSGLVAKLMAERGFKHFVGVDGSEGMLAEAGNTGLYQDLRLALLGTQRLPAKPGTFDVVVIVAALRDGYVPVSVVRELCDAAKPGGYVCLSRVNRNTESGNEYGKSLDRELQLMEEEGLWTQVASEEMNKYMMDVYHDFEDNPMDHYLCGTMFLYKKSAN